MIYALIGSLIIIGFLGFKLFLKLKIDQLALDDYQYLIDTARDMLHDLSVEQHASILRSAKYKAEYEGYKQKCEYELLKLEECKKDLQAALDTYNDITENKLKEIDASMETLRLKRQAELDEELKTKTELYESYAKEKEDWAIEVAKAADTTIEEESAKCKAKCEECYALIADAENKFESIIRTLRSYEADKLAKLYYTIQLSDEFKDDIEFLLTTVAAKVLHPDIISKLVWAEYMKPNLDETFKRVDVRPEPGIYKITNIETGKAYIGKSTNVKTRIADHFKSAIGITNIADQAVHHAIRQEGFWNWSIEIVLYCDKEKLSELEKYYIEFFKTLEFGYNKNSGGGG